MVEGEKWERETGKKPTETQEQTLEHELHLDFIYMPSTAPPPPAHPLISCSMC